MHGQCREETSGERGTMAKFDLEPGEQELGHWTMHYLPPSGGKSAGKLAVTDRRVLYEPLKAGFFGRQDFSAKGVAGSVGGRMSAGMMGRREPEHPAGRRAVCREEAHPWHEAGRRDARRRQEFVFDNGLMSVDKLVGLLGGTAGAGCRQFNSDPRHQPLSLLPHPPAVRRDRNDNACAVPETCRDGRECVERRGHPLITGRRAAHAVQEAAQAQARPHRDGVHERVRQRRRGRA